jgi:hypothetical protein
MAREGWPVHCQRIIGPVLGLDLETISHTTPSDELLPPTYGGIGKSHAAGDLDFCGCKRLLER